MDLGLRQVQPIQGAIGRGLSSVYSKAVSTVFKPQKTMTAEYMQKATAGIKYKEQMIQKNKDKRKKSKEPETTTPPSPTT